MKPREKSKYPDRAWGQEAFRGPDEQLRENPPGSTASEHIDDFDSSIAEPSADVKRFKNQVEYIDNRGPLGAGD